MGYQDVPKGVKIQAVTDVLKGEKVTEAARKYNVGRRSIYMWINQAMEGMEKGIELEKCGPKVKKPKPDPKMEEIEKLNRLLKKQQDVIKELEGMAEFYQKKAEPPRPTKCPKCGCEKIYRNGTYKITPKRFFDLLKSKKEKEITVQQYICVNCEEPIHPEDKSFFPWAYSYGS